MDLLAALGVAFLGSIGAVVAAGAVIYLGNRSSRFMLSLVSFATGTLLGAALLGMIPSAAEKASVTSVGGWVLAGLLIFFVAERLMLWRHAHGAAHTPHASNASGQLILIGDAVHNAMDGLAIGAAFAGGGSLGVSVAIAVIVHEVAQEVGDFAILIESGFSRDRAMFYNVLSSAGTIPAAVIAYFLADRVESVMPAFLGLAAASFLYIALADLVPRHHEQLRVRDLAWQLPLIGLGVFAIAFVRLFD